MKTNGFLVSIALAAGVGIGFLAGGGNMGGSSAAATRDSQARSRPLSRPNPGQETPASRARASPAATIEDTAGRLSLAPNPETLSDALDAYTEWARKDPHAAITRAIALGEAGGHLRHRVMQIWARQDPVSAAGFFSVQRSSFLQMGPQNGVLGHLGTPSAVARAIAREWSIMDPGAAEAWVRTLPPEDNALRTVIGTMAETSPALAIAAVSGIPPENQTAYLSEIAKNWAARDYSEACKWIDQLPPERREEVLASAIGGLMESDPQRAAGELLSQASPGMQERLAASLGRIWSQQNPHAAADWLRQPGNEAVRSAAVGPVIETLGRRDSRAAWNLVQALDGSDAYDPSLAAYIRARSDQSPESLLELAASIRDEASRGQTIALIISQWSARDPDAASTYRSHHYSK